MLPRRSGQIGADHLFNLVKSHRYSFKSNGLKMHLERGVLRLSLHLGLHLPNDPTQE